MTLDRMQSDWDDACVGVDIAPRMVALARRWNTATPACTFALNDTDGLRLFPDAQFDFVYTRIVLQHVPPRASARYVAELVRVLRPHGLLVFELPSAMPLRSRVQGRRRVYALLRRLGVSPARLYRTFGLTPIRMSWLSEPAVVGRVEPAGRVLEIVRTALPKWTSSTYYVTKDPGP